MRLNKKQKHNLKVGAGVVGAAALIGLAIKAMNSNKTVPSTIVKPTTNALPKNVVPGAPLSAVPINMGALNSGNMPATVVPTGSTQGSPGGGGIIQTLASNPFINPIAIVPKIFGGGGLFGR